MEELVEVLSRYNISYSQHKVIPFIGELEPNIDISGNVIVFGSYSMRHVVNKKGWSPGCFVVPGIDEINYRWQKYMLNHDAKFCTFEQSLEYADKNNDFFIRPVADSKVFSGTIMNYQELHEWWNKVVILEEDDGTSLRGSTPVMIASPKNIYKEYRFWVVKRKIVTGCLYKLGNRILYQNIDSGLDMAVQVFASSFTEYRVWQPTEAYCMDIALTDDGFKIIEINCMNAAGLYEANIGLLVESLEQGFST